MGVQNTKILEIHFGILNPDFTSVCCSDADLAASVAAAWRRRGGGGETPLVERCTAVAPLQASLLCSLINQVSEREGMR